MAQNQIAAVLNGMAAKLRQHETTIAQMAASMHSRQPVRGTPTGWPEQLPRFIEDIPGKRVPYVYVAQASFSTTSVGTRSPLTFQVSQDGPFVATYLTAHWRPTAGANAGRWRPISSNSGINTAEGFAADGVDFEYEIQQSGADRMWQGSTSGNIARSSRDLFCDAGDGRPHYLGIAGFIERDEQVSVAATMLRNPSYAGLLKFEFHGYKIISPIAFAG